MKKILSLSLALCLCVLTAFPLASCKGPTVFDPNAVGTPSVTPDISFGKTDTDMFSSRDFNRTYDASSAVRITMTGDAIECDAKSVKVEGASATILSGGTYLLSGNLEGEITVFAGDLDKVHLILDGVDIMSPTAPIIVMNADKVFITLAEGSENILISSGGSTLISGVNVDGAVFSTTDLSFGGSGSLAVYSLGSHGIVSNDDLVFTGGSYEVEAMGHALKGNDSIRVCGDTSFTLTAEKDGLHSENNDNAERGFVYLAGGSYTITASGDGISASAHMQIRGGSYTIKTDGGYENGKEHIDNGPGGQGGPGGPGGGMPRGAATDATVSAKGLKAGGGMLIEGGSFTLDTADDALHSDADLAVKGGSLSIRTGDDACHADVTLAIFGGTVDVSASYEGLEAQHVELLGGSVTLVCDDDGINAAGGNDDSGNAGGFGGDFVHGGGNGSVNIAGGVLYMNASGDGIDANGSFTMSGGKVTICGPTKGDTAVLDFDKSAIITGGYFIGTGSQMMAQTFSEVSTQGVIALSVGNQAAGTAISLSGGNAQFSYSPILPFQILILSTPDMVKGQEYTVTIGELSAKFKAY